MSTVLHGTPVVPGIAYAPAVWARRPQLPPTSAPDLPEHERENEVARFEHAAQLVADGLMARAARSQGHAAEVLTVTASIAMDRAWKKDVVKRIRTGVPAIQSTMAATAKYVDLFEKLGGLMAERTADLRDVRDRTLARLQGIEEPGIPDVTSPSILLADDLAPADTAGLNPAMYVAIATELGGPTSHTSIIARQLGIPCIVAARQLPEIPSGEPVLLNGLEGTITRGLPADEAESLVQADAQRLAEIAGWTGPAATKDGVPIQLLANVQDGEAARIAASGHAEGVGLFRTELLFLDTALEPSVDEQAQSYAPVFRAFPHSKVVVRTLDAGSDKPVPFATLIEEANPALGVRGIRTTGHNPQLLHHQLDAIAQAAQSEPGTDVWVMAPMISTVPEAEWFAGLVRERGLKAGIMVEVPSTAILIDAFLEHVDFVSIGTNDLCQYTMAADRMSPDLAEYTDPWQPAPLALMGRIAAAGQRAGKPVGVCGEAAADPVLAAVLVGMGVSSLSMASSAVPAVGALLAKVTMDQCKAAAEAVKRAVSQGEARAVARRALGI